MFGARPLSRLISITKNNQQSQQCLSSIRQFSSQVKSKSTSTFDRRPNDGISKEAQDEYTKVTEQLAAINRTRDMNASQDPNEDEYSRYVRLVKQKFGENSVEFKLAEQYRVRNQPVSTSESSIKAIELEDMSDIPKRESKPESKPTLSSDAAFEKPKGAVTPMKPRVPILDKHGRSYGHGSRKTAAAHAILKKGSGEFFVNHKPAVSYFHRFHHRGQLAKPFEATGTTGLFDVYCSTKGGGLSGQADACKLAIARSLSNFDPASYKTILKNCGLLKRDPRAVERKKPGHFKARKSFTWVKR